MKEVSQSLLNSDEWCEVRGFSEREDGSPLPKYEAKFVQDVGEEFIDDELVIVKETQQFRSERMYYVPREVVVDIARRLPELGTEQD